MIFNDILEVFEGQKTETETVHGLVVLMKKNVLDLNDHKAGFEDDISESIGNIIPFLNKLRLSFQLVSATVSDPTTGRGKVGEKANLEDWITTLPSLAAGELHFNIKFKWGEDMGIPGAVIVNNHHPNEFYLKSITLLDLNGKGQDLIQGSIYFNCYSWVYPVELYKSSRVFFANNTYLPSSTPVPLRAYRDDELVQLRGDNINCELKKHHRVYRYAYYNDLGKPDEGEDSARPVLGGSQEYPYPRRGRTGRRPSAADPHSESRLSPLASLDIYVPRDERFGHLKLSDFIAYALKAFAEGLLPGLKGYLTHRSFDTFEEVLSLYKDGLPLPDIPHECLERIPFELIKELLTFDGDRLSFPVPQVIQEDPSGWRNDEEFGRQMLAGLNPVIIQRLKEFPPTSKLDPEEYGNHESSITAADIIKSMDGLTVDQAVEKERLFILDHHDTLMPYLNRINTHTNNKIYATRTLLFLKDDCTLKPIAIELSLPHMKGEQHGAFSKVYTPPKHAVSGVEKSIWELAKAFVAVNDSGVHQLISHWLNTHAVMEPFVIATNRQLSVIHPIHKLLVPHFRDTMNINALARQILICADGLLEMTVFPGRFAMEMSSVIYKDWKLTEQGLPDDLLKRGLAVEDHSKPHKLRLLIEDYPYAVDGLAIWSAIETWVTEYCSIYYPDDASVGADNELQAWWKEIREVGHGDKKDEFWWPKLQSVSELNKICTTIIWVGSALHAAVNFGQYPYAGYLPNRPTLSRRLMPKEGSPEYKELMSNPDKVFLHTITGQFETVVGVGLIEILSRHSTDEVYLGQRNSSAWTSDKRAKDALDKFQHNLVEIEKQILERNNDKKLKNRRGPVNVPYTLLYPNTSNTSREGGLTGKGVPNSVSI